MLLGVWPLWAIPLVVFLTLAMILAFLWLLPPMIPRVPDHRPEFLRFL